MNLKEIEARLSDIRQVLEKHDADVVAMDKEARGLIEEKHKL